VTPPHVKPEWYFLRSYQVLRLIPNKTLRILAQIVAVTGIVLLSFLDCSPRRHILRRPLFLTVLYLAVE
jgi:quinol-cytochrome oxidoreductase complex cytochrome b subunit